MATKIDSTTPVNEPTAQVSAPIAPTASAPKETRALGTIAHVKTALGVLLINNETNAYFKPGEPTPVTVTVTTLRRIDDGDLFWGEM